MRGAIAVATAVSCASPVFAQDIRLSIPIACNLGEDEPCFIQNYVDADPGPGYTDFACQPLSYNGHKGTDFALRSEADLARDVPVLAAAAGVVKGTRNTIIDRLYTPETAAAAKGKECGNGLVIDHGDGWETQYCHMKQGSVRVKTGDRITAGDILGAVGLSGKTQFPHLHLSVRHNGKTIDPFNPSGQKTCQVAPSETLWSMPPTYQAGGVIDAGFAAEIPDYSTVKSGTAGSETLPATSSALVLWGYAFGSQTGDTLVMEIRDNSDNVVFENTVELTKAQAQFFRAGGRRTQGAAWFQPGTYTGTVQMMRNGAVISDTTTTVTIIE